MKHAYLLSLLSLMMSSCIKDDFIDDRVDPIVRIINKLDTLGVGSEHVYEGLYLSDAGLEEDVSLQWRSTNPFVVTIDSETGLAEGLVLGESTIIAERLEEGLLISDSSQVVVGENTVMQILEPRSGTIATTSSYLLTGDFILEADGDGLQLIFEENYAASTSLPGLYVYLTNNPNSRIGALEIGAVSTFSGAHSYFISNTTLDDYSYVLYYCAPFNVKVGDGAIL